MPKGYRDDGSPIGAGGNTALSKLRKLLETLEQQTDAVRMTLSLMNGHEVVKKSERHTTVLTEALAIDGARREKKGKTKAGKKKSNYLQMMADRRTRIRAVLGALDRDAARPIDTVVQAASEKAGFEIKGQSLGQLIKNGLVKKKGDGYIRTAKEYEERTR